MTEDDLRPARPARRDDEPTDEVAPPESVAPPSPVDDEALALERGRTAAVVAALGRIQMSLDILSRRVAALETAVRDLRRD
jgi:hypothetical protein